MSETIQIDPLLLQQLQSNGFLLQDSIDRNVISSSLVQLDIDPSSLTSNVDVDIACSLSDDQDLSAVPQRIKNITLQKPADFFECDICMKKYNSKAILKKHKKIHGIEQEFRCTLCRKGFSNKEMLEDHSKFHSGYRPFSCELCNNTFSYEGSLKTHMKR